MVDQRYINEKVNSGYVHARVIIQVVGKPKENVEKGLELYLKRLKDDKAIEILSIEKAPAEPEDQLFKTHAEIEILVAGAEKLVWFCFDYLPSSIEIIEPRQLIYKAADFTDFLNELQSRLHSLDLALKAMTLENNKLKDNGAQIIKNIIRLITLHGADLGKMSRETGIPKDHVQMILNDLLEKNFIEKKEDNYFWKHG